MVNTEKNGFTIVELLVVIVIIAILASVTIVSYLNIQQRSRDTKIKSDLSSLNQAIIMARINTGKVLYEITGTASTDGNCLNSSDGADLKTDSECIADYINAVDKISIASGVDVSHLLDPWGRPYAINENESFGEGTPFCENDTIAAYSYPFLGWQLMNGTQRQIAFYQGVCD